MVAREIKRDKRMDLFSATPPLETLKILIAHCAQSQKGSKPKRERKLNVPILNKKQTSIMLNCWPQLRLSGKLRRTSS